MPPKRSKTSPPVHTDDVEEERCFPSLGFLSSCVLLNRNARSCINNYDNPSQWRVPQVVTDLHSEGPLHGYLLNVNLNPHLGFCTICESYSWLPERNQMAGPCWRCRGTGKAAAEPEICRFTRRILRRWGYTSHDQGSSAWLDARDKMLTASDAYVPLGVKGFKTAKKLLWEKAAIAPKAAPTYMMLLGNEREPIARKKYERARGVRVYLLGLIPLPGHPWLGASPDGITSDGKLVEIKCPISRMIGKGSVPDLYVSQVQLQLQALEADELHFVQYKPGTPDKDAMFAHFACEDEFTIKSVGRDDRWFARALPKLRDFYLQIQEARRIERAAVALLQAALLGALPLADTLAEWRRARNLPTYPLLVQKTTRRPRKQAPAKKVDKKEEEDFSMCEDYALHFVQN